MRKGYSGQGLTARAPRSAREGCSGRGAGRILEIVYELTIQSEFAAAHAITIAGEREPVHGHNWRVTVVVQGDTLDADGLLCDFHLVERSLKEVVAPFHNRDLNAIAPFDRLNPTAEHVARHIAEQLQSALARELPAGARVSRVGVTEAPGCEATYHPPEPQ